MAGDKDIFLVAQLDQGCDHPERDDLYDVGMVAQVLQLLKLPDGTVRVLVEGQQRARLAEMTKRDGYVLAETELIDEEGGDRHAGRGADAQRARPVRRLRQAQQEAARGHRERARRDRRRRPAGRRDRRRARRQGRHQAVAADRNRPAQAAGDGLFGDGRRAVGAPGRAQDPRPREAPDGEDPARILPQRATQGDPERARRRRGRARATSSPSCRTRSTRSSCRRKPKPRPRPSSRSCARCSR